MTRNTLATRINVLIREELDGFYARSADLAGLSVWGKDEAQVFDRVEKAIVLLYKLNHGIDVEVVRAVDPVTFKPRSVAPSNDFVVAKAA